MGEKGCPRSPKYTLLTVKVFFFSSLARNGLQQTPLIKERQRERETQTDRHTDRQTDRDRETHRQREDYQNFKA